MVVYVCQMFPWVTQTFTVREVTLVRKEGLDVQVASFLEPPDELMDAAARALFASTSFLPPPWSLAAWLPLLRLLGRRPLAVAGLLAEGLFGRGLVHTSLRMRLRGVLAVARGAWLVARYPDAGLFHAEFADEAASAAMAAAAFSGARFSFKSHSSFNPQQLRRKVERAAFVAVENEFDRRLYFRDVPEERILLNRSGVVPGEVLARSERSGGPLRILSIGTLQEKKGHRFLLEALRILDGRGVPWRCVVVGSGPLEGELRGLAAAGRLEGRLALEPYRPHEELLALYGQHEVFALPCVVTDAGDRDGIPNVLIEAAAAGCVLVSAPVSGIPELIEDGVSGLLVPERDAESLADALERLAADPGLRADLARGAAEVVRERFDLTRNAGDLARRFRTELALRAD